MKVVPQSVPVAVVRRLDSGEALGPAPVQHVHVAPVPAPVVVPRQLDLVGRRLIDLQRENEHLRARLRSA